MLHVPLPEQGRRLGQMVRRYLAYHAVPTNARAITSFVYDVTWQWKRRAPITAQWLPPARILHPYPQQRFIAQHPRWEPSALAAHARICPGARGNPRPHRDG
jgi:RNA-directed DNA polymerase